MAAAKAPYFARAFAQAVKSFVAVENFSKSISTGTLSSSVISFFEKYAFSLSPRIFSPRAAFISSACS